VTGFFLIPVYGSETSYRFLTLVPICIGLLLIIPGMKDGKRPTTKAITSILGASLAIALTLPMVNSSWNRLRITSGTNVYFSPGYVEQDTELLFFHEDIYGGFTTVVRNRTTDQVSTTLLTNGKFQANDTGEVPIQISFALLPALHQKNRDRALVIGLGSGQTANAVAATGYQHIDIAEIAPGIVAAAQQEFLHINNNVLSRSHVKLHIEDGRNQLLRSRSRYDLITIELNSVWFAGSTNLYSREFYALAKQRLTSGGILLQWIQLHHISTPELITILATVRAEFPYVSLSVVQGTGLILASASPLGLDNVAMEEMAQRPELAELLSSPFITLANAQVDELAVKRILMSLSRLQLLNAAEITRLAAVAEEKRLPLNTDGNRFIEFSTPRHNLEQHDHRKVNINNLFEFVTPSRRSQQAARFGIDLP
jgi:spermidine synthase